MNNDFKNRLNMANEIKVGAVCHITKEELLRTPESILLKRAMEYLSVLLSYEIINKTNVFETKEVYDGIQMRAECYVLTPNDFSELVERIQRDLIRFGSNVPMIGGVSSL